MFKQGEQMHIPTLSKLRSMASIDAARERIRVKRNQLRREALAQREYEAEHPLPSVVNLAATIQADRKDAELMLRYLRASIREAQRNQEES
jgi:hypothetical protein